MFDDDDDDDDDADDARPGKKAILLKLSLRLKLFLEFTFSGWTC